MSNAISHAEGKRKAGRPRAIRWFTLWNAMLAAGVDEEMLAIHLEVAVGTVQDWLTGARTPSLSKLLKIASFLDLDASLILPGKSTKKILPRVKQFAK